MLLKCTNGYIMLGQHGTVYGAANLHLDKVVFKSLNYI